MPHKVFNPIRIEFNPYLGSYEAISDNGEKYPAIIRNNSLLCWISGNESLSDFPYDYSTNLKDDIAIIG